MSDETPAEVNLRLAMALLDDEESVLEEILRRFGPDILEVLHGRFAKRLGALRYEDIEDVVSVALDRLWKGRAKYDDSKQSIRAWFYCIAENVALDVLKHGWYKARRLEENLGQDLLEEKATTVEPKSAVASRDGNKKMAKEAGDLQTVLKKLPDVQRAIVMADAACRDGNASNEYLADELGIPAANVRVYRGRAYTTIRKEMRKLGHDIPEPIKDKS